MTGGSSSSTTSRSHVCARVCGVCLGGVLMETRNGRGRKWLWQGSRTPHPHTQSLGNNNQQTLMATTPLSTLKLLPHCGLRLPCPNHFHSTTACDLPAPTTSCPSPAPRPPPPPPPPTHTHTRTQSHTRPHTHTHTGDLLVVDDEDEGAREHDALSPAAPDESAAVGAERRLEEGRGAGGGAEGAPQQPAAGAEEGKRAPRVLTYREYLAQIKQTVAG